MKRDVRILLLGEGKGGERGRGGGAAGPGRAARGFGSWWRSPRHAEAGDAGCSPRCGCKGLGARRRALRRRAGNSRRGRVCAAPQRGSVQCQRFPFLS